MLFHQMKIYTMHMVNRMHGAIFDKPLMHSIFHALLNKRKFFLLLNLEAMSIDSDSLVLLIKRVN